MKFNENDMNKDEYNAEKDGNLYGNNIEDNTIKNNNVNVLVGIFETEIEAITVINRLKESGYPADEIAVVAKNKDQMDSIEEQTDVDTNSDSLGGKVGPGAAIGATLGGMTAALPALGMLLVPGVGPLLAAGPIAIILGGAITGGIAGGLLGALVELGINEEDAKEYENYINQGKILVIVKNREGLGDDINNTFKQNNSIIDNSRG